MTKEKIIKEMKIDEVLKNYPETLSVFVKYGFHCIGCAAANFETLEQGAMIHGITTEELIEELNKAVRN